MPDVLPSPPTQTQARGLFISLRCPQDPGPCGRQTTEPCQSLSGCGVVVALLPFPPLPAPTANPKEVDGAGAKIQTEFFPQT